MAHLDIWSDVACPWCFIGKRRLEKALAQLNESERPSIRWHAYQLMPDFPEGEATPARPMLERKFGGAARVAQMMAHLRGVASAEGIHFNVDEQMACNTGLAHRAVSLARERGREDAAVEGFFKAMFEEGKNLASPEVVAAVLVDALRGLPDAEEGALRDALVAGLGADDVQMDRREAEELGIRGVPFFLLDERLAVSGAQDPQVFVEFLRAAQRTDAH